VIEVNSVVDSVIMSLELGLEPEYEDIEVVEEFRIWHAFFETPSTKKIDLGDNSAPIAELVALEIETLVMTELSTSFSLIPSILNAMPSHLQDVIQAMESNREGEDEESTESAVTLEMLRQNSMDLDYADKLHVLLQSMIQSLGSDHPTLVARLSSASSANDAWQPNDLDELRSILYMFLEEQLGKFNHYNLHNVHQDKHQGQELTREERIQHLMDLKRQRDGDSN